MIQINKRGELSLDQLFPHKDTSIVCYYVVKKNKQHSFALKFYDAEGRLLTDLPPKKKIRCTRNLVNMTKSYTQGCWSQAVKFMSKKHGMTERDLKAHIELRDQLDQEYRNRLSTLPTDVLEAIMLCHQRGKFGRAAITLKSISDEITRRVLLNDQTSMSEIKKNRNK